MSKKIIILALVLVMSITAFVAFNKLTNKNSTDVLIIGGGGAGLVSAITAADNDSKVILVEKMPGLGGNTIISATGITASDTKLHKEAGVTFSVEDHFKKTMETGKNLPDEKLTRILVENSNSAFEWLLSIGLTYKLQDAEKEPWWIVPVEGHYGAQLVGAYKDEVNKRKDKIDVRLQNRATELIYKDGKVTGAKIVDKDGKEYTINAKSVIIATGGFGYNPELMAEYNPKFKGAHKLMSTPGATGDGFLMAVAIGAGMRDMEYHQMRPLATDAYWIKETVLKEKDLGGILVNMDAKRFVNETLAPLELVPQILAQKDRIAYVIFDSNVAALKDGKAAVEKARMVKADTIEEMAGLLGLDIVTLVESVNAYNEGQDEFGRENLGKIVTGPFYGVKVAPSSHFTMAGITINENAQVTDKDGKVIEGLYAAGEVVGGLYGAGRVAGNNTLDDIVFGKIAGKHSSGK